jgi:hypothetical protein
MIIKYKIYTDRNLLVDVLSGNIGMPELEKVYLHETKNKDFIYVKKVISNIIDSNLILSLENVQDFLTLMISPNPDDIFRWAILTAKPDQTAFSLLLKENEYFDDVIGVFSTLEACNRFLNISFEEKEFGDEDYIILD